MAFEKFWYSHSLLTWFLWPLSLPFKSIVRLRKFFLIRFRQKKVGVPLIVVGNLTVGGSGKTPLVIALVEACLKKGFKPGVVSRGYKASIKNFPHLIEEKDSAMEVGDEPLLIAKTTGCPVVIAPNRLQAAQFLLKHCTCDLIISDDGLQHYAMGRSLEIVVIDGLNGFGNGFSLPAGPLREEPARLKQADFIVINGNPTHPTLETIKKHPHFTMTLNPSSIQELATGSEIKIQNLPEPVAAVTGIGHPSRFFNTLESLAIRFNPYPYPDHYPFKAENLNFEEPALIMTTKDAVKCKAFAKESWYFLTVKATLSDTFWKTFWLAIKDFQ